MKGTNRILSRRSLIRTVSFMIATVSVLAALAIVNHIRAENYRRSMEYEYAQSLTDLMTSMREIDSSLQKCVYSTSPATISSACTNIYGYSMLAEAAIARLPASSAELSNLVGFINKVGDYAYALSKTSASGGDVSEYTENLSKLSDTANILSDNVVRLQADINNGRVNFLKLQTSDGSVDAQGMAEEGSGNIGDSFKSIESEFPEIPSLIYDGPFSQHLESAEPKIAALEEISIDEAREIAKSFTGLDSFDFEYTSEGKLPVYGFGGETSSIEVTRNGGVVLAMFTSDYSGEAVIEVKEAAQKAKEFLSQNGFENMHDSYWTINGGVAVFNFAATQDEVTLYPDLVKVSVSLSDGKVIGLEGRGYAMNHYTRELPEAVVTEDQALAKVASGLEVLSHDMAVIPSDGKNELLCHEFTCKDAQDRHYIVYVSAVTGEQERIFILLEDESGTLTM